MDGNNYKPPTEAEIAVAAAKYGTIPMPAMCHKCGGYIISGVCIVTSFGGLICPVCLRKVDEEREQNEREKNME